MVLASPKPHRSETILPNDVIPIIDLKGERCEVIKLIVKASEEFGFFKVINHGILDETIDKMEEAGFSFFAKPMNQKKLSSPAYGSKNIGFNGDIGEVEYLLLNANTSSIAQISKTISLHDPHSNFRYLIKTTFYVFHYSSLVCQNITNFPSIYNTSFQTIDFPSKNRVSSTYFLIVNNHDKLQNFS